MQRFVIGVGEDQLRIFVWFLFFGQDGFGIGTFGHIVNDVVFFRAVFIIRIITRHFPDDVGVDTVHGKIQLAEIEVAAAAQQRALKDRSVRVVIIAAQGSSAVCRRQGLFGKVRRCIQQLQRKTEGSRVFDFNAFRSDHFPHMQVIRVGRELQRIAEGHRTAHQSVFTQDIAAFVVPDRFRDNAFPIGTRLHMIVDGEYVVIVGVFIKVI